MSGKAKYTYICFSKFYKGGHLSSFPVCFPGETSELGSTLKKEFDPSKGANSSPKNAPSEGANSFLRKLTQTAKGGTDENDRVALLVVG